MNIAIIGAGNVAWHLAQALATVGQQVKAVYSRTPKSREDLASLLPGALPVASLDLLNVPVDVVLVAVPDAVLATVVDELHVQPGTIVAHTSGSQPLQVLQTVAGARTGVLYPLQTFSKSKQVDFSHIPLLLEAQDEQTLNTLKVLAGSLSSSVHVVATEARKHLHLAAVFACNFTNHLLGISQQILQEAHLPKELLQPLIEETVAKASQQDPYNVQTGPAVRRDANVLQDHLRMLQGHPRFQSIYELLTQSIQVQSSEDGLGKGQG
ncbi:putative short-subunit dehydrogenase-like oxidoreductase (DUF2520 family) [Pontibacter ummariensis]|uniref:Predicted oxidoreductase, contains short-chain dehydrogenase (SDR) and DUF2520 domains n=1 Tax=Pontibacter ummariensis TaxID=1610492 RepID=A0A239HIX9_9BACT|nr:Rossmann-like and DUF2520 domain-containing protein [Pontibacter ummariensis]PRY10603.1 putative short-subunit dehydrogenase-like oxidoreductase (DUF2520 family) [Pontibacter ummariensis]SNS80224.1 Predicted oxidoreductase, contains short-chain dehydrogenase (SDR) and DUF2520 domains [Pontibacter ummariensis]